MAKRPHGLRERGAGRLVFHDVLLALLSGALLALSFPKFGHPVFGWIALTPSMLAVARASGLGPAWLGGAGLAPASLRRVFWLGFLASCLYFAGTLYWITEVMVTFGGLPRPVAIVVNVLLVAFLALFPVSFYLMLGLALRRWGVEALLLAPLFWVTQELGRTFLLGGFPWVLLGYSQATVLPVAQLASVFGVYGVSALVAFVSTALAYAAVRDDRRGWLVACGAAGAVIGVASWGGVRMAGDALTRAGEPLRVGLVQGNVAQQDKWNPAFAGRILRTYLRLSREAAGEGAELIIWPESATPFLLEEDPAGTGAIRNLALETGAHFLIGSDQIERAPEFRIYNAAFLVRPDGRTAGVYRKMHLVPFGEYVPFKELLFFAAPLVESVSDFSPGVDPVVLPVGSHGVTTAICYEVVYPSLIRRFVQAGSELLTTITNDAWYGSSSAPHQHFEQAAMRSIEQGRYLARAANTGISGVVDPYGRVVARSGLFETTRIVADVRLITGRTVYGTIGDAFGYASVAATLVVLGMLLTAGRRARRAL